MLLRTCLIAAAAHVAFAANIIRYTDRTAFNSDTNNRVVVDFEDARQCGGMSDMFNPVALKGITLTGGANRFTSRGACSPPLTPFQNWVLTTRLFGNTPDTTRLTATLPAGTMAVSFDAGISDESAASGEVEITLVTSDGQSKLDLTATITSGPTGRQSQPVFVGFTSSRPITAVRWRIRNIGDANIVLDNVTTAQTAPPLITTTNGVVRTAPVSEHPSLRIPG